MVGFRKRKTELDVTGIIDGIEQAIYAAVKPYGFRKYGRTLHRFVSGDISQVIHFQCGPFYRNRTHLMAVNLGIRVPECVLRSFLPEESPKKYYHEHECNIRSRLGTIEGKQESWYDLRRSPDRITADIIRKIQKYVIPAFETLNSRDAILEKRRDFPLFDTLNGHLILLEEAMIYGRRGEREKAAEVFRQYCFEAKKAPDTPPSHLRYLDSLASELGIEIT